MACEPNQVLISDSILYPAVMITWGTDGIADHPGETFDGGSGYFASPEYVITAKHVGELIRRDYGVREGCFEVGYALQVHDPRNNFTWRVTDERPVRDLDLSVLRVDMSASEHLNQDQITKWIDEFRYPCHRASALDIDEIISIRGFSMIGGDLIKDERASGGSQHVYVSSDGHIGSGKLEDIRALGNMSGGPACDRLGRVVGVISESPEGDGCHTLISDWNALIGSCPFIKARTAGMVNVKIGTEADAWEMTIRVDETES